MGIGLFLEGIFPVFWIVLGAQVIWGIGATFISGSDIAWISDEGTKKKTDHTILKGHQFEQIFMFSGIFLSIFIASFKINYPIIISGLSFFLLGIFLFFFMSENNYTPVKKKKSLNLMFVNFNKGIKAVKLPYLFNQFGVFGHGRSGRFEMRLGAQAHPKSYDTPMIMIKGCFFKQIIAYASMAGNRHRSPGNLA